MHFAKKQAMFKHL